MNFIEKIAMEKAEVMARTRDFIKKRLNEGAKNRMNNVVDFSVLSKTQKTINPDRKKVNLSLEIPKTSWGKGYFKEVTP